MNPLATLTTEEREGFDVAHLEGEVDLSNAADLLERLLAAIPNRSRGVILDLSTTDYLDSAGLRLVFETRRALRERRQELRVIATPGTFVDEVLTTAGLKEVVPVDASVADSLGAASRPPTPD